MELEGFVSMRFYPIGVARSKHEGFVMKTTEVVRDVICSHHKNKRLPKNLTNPRRAQLPPDFGANLFFKKPDTTSSCSPPLDKESEDDLDDEEGEQVGDNGIDVDPVWESEEIEAISSLFQGRIPQKPGKLNRERPLPLPLPHRLRPLGLPTPNRRIRSASQNLVSSPTSMSDRVHKNPTFLIGLARTIKCLGPDQSVSLVLDDCAHLLRKGSLSMTIRELGHMGLHDRALETFSWAQKQPHLFPDDRILASTVEVLARSKKLKVPINLQEFNSLASRAVIEAMVRGFIKGGNFDLAYKLLLIAKDCNRILDSHMYVKLILELIKNPDKHMLVANLLDELGERENLNLSLQDYTAIMKVGIKLGNFDIVEGLYSLFKQSRHELTVVMYTMIIHSRYTAKKYKEAVAVVWEMEASNCLLDLPAYRVVIKLFVALNDLPRAARYFAKLKEAGFAPTYDLYRDVISIYMVSGRIAKCKEILKEAEVAGLQMEKKLVAGLLQLESGT